MSDIMNYSAIIEDMHRKLERKIEEIARLEQWVNDLHSGMYINCVYCGHRYGPKDKTSPTMQQALYDHIAKCPKHPLSKAKAEIERLRLLLYRVGTYLKNACPDTYDSRELIFKIEQAFKAHDGGEG